MEGKSKTGLKILISVTLESYKWMNFLIAQDLSISFYNTVVPDAFHTQCWLRFDDPVVIYLSFYDHTASKNLVKIHHLFFSSRKANGTIFSLSSWCSQGTSQKHPLSLKRFSISLFPSRCSLFYMSYLIFYILLTHTSPFPHHSFSSIDLSWVRF